MSEVHPTYLDALRRRFADDAAQVAIVGLGYVGLPLAIAFAEAGLRVVGVDVSAQRVEALNGGDPCILDISPDRLRAALDSGLFSATTDYPAIQDCDAVSICVPTPLRKTGDPDMSYIVDAIRSAAPYLRVGAVLVLESTTYPGTTTEVVRPMLEAEGLRVGDTVFLAFSPERIDPGRTDFTVETTPKVIGGQTPACLAAAMAYYGRAIRSLVPVSSTEAAEMAKLLENTFRAVNIGLANETMIMCDKLGLDVWEIIDAAASKPFGFMKFTPGPGLGGHCIPIDPLYLSWRLKTLNYNARFIELASEINTQMPRYWVQKVQDVLNDQAKALKGSRVLVLGVTYKRDVSDLRESPALDIIELLREKGADVAFHDPYVDDLAREGLDLTRVDKLDDAIRDADCVVVGTDHSAYDWDHISRLGALVVDTRNALPSVPGKATPMRA